MNKPAQNKRAFSSVFLILLVVVLAIIAIFAYYNSHKVLYPTSETGLLPSPSERTNPAPVGTDSLSVQDVNPGTVVNLSQVTLSNDGYVSVYKDTGSKRILAGKSELLTKGVHSNVVVKTTELKEGEVTFVSLETKTGLPVKDENGHAIEVLKNVGRLMMMMNSNSEY